MRMLLANAPIYIKEVCKDMGPTLCRSTQSGRNIGRSTRAVDSELTEIDRPILPIASELTEHRAVVSAGRLRVNGTLDGQLGRLIQS